jgi:hypothetical protein
MERCSVPAGSATLKEGIGAGLMETERQAGLGQSGQGGSQTVDLGHRGQYAGILWMRVELVKDLGGPGLLKEERMRVVHW